MPKRHETNVEFVTHIMNHSRHGAMMQLFILTAIEKYAQQCIKAGAATFDNPMIIGQSWVGTAQEALDELNQRSTPKARLVNVPENEYYDDGEEG